MKKNVSLILALVMLMGLMVAAPVSADSAPVLVEGEILNSVGEDSTHGYSVAFYVTANVSGMDVKPGTFNADYTNATIEYNGVQASVVEMGVMFTNKDSASIDPEQLCVGAEEGVEDIIRVPVQYLYTTPEADSCVYAARIIKVPEFARDCVLTARPYVTVTVEGAAVTLYSDVDRASYLDVWGIENDNNIVMPKETVALTENITVDVATVYSLNPENTSEILMDVEFTVQNNGAYVTDNYSWFEYGYSNESESYTAQVDISNIAVGDTATYKASLPLDTKEIIIGDSVVYNRPILPAIGSDIDVTKKKNRIRVSAASSVRNEDGTSTVYLTFKNYTSNWITEETDYIQYTYYNAAGTKIKTETLYIGVIDTKKHPVKTFEFDLPATAASVKITKSKIVYWTEWS